ncbi:hypothetical protein D1872_308660 [compost metagenome]
MKIRTGATNKAICRLLPTAISTEAPILFFMASMMAALCSAAFPMIATRKAPTNNSLKPNCVVNVSSVPTSHSLTKATIIVAMTR